MESRPEAELQPHALPCVQEAVVWAGAAVSLKYCRELGRKWLAWCGLKNGTMHVLTITVADFRACFDHVGRVLWRDGDCD